jgi:hypothetical protein
MLHRTVLATFAIGVLCQPASTPGATITNPASGSQYAPTTTMLASMSTGTGNGATQQCIIKLFKGTVIQSEDVVTTGPAPSFIWTGMHVPPGGMPPMGGWPTGTDWLARLYTIGGTQIAGPFSFSVK